MATYLYLTRYTERPLGFFNFSSAKKDREIFINEKDILSITKHQTNNKINPTYYCITLNTHYLFYPKRIYVNIDHIITGNYFNHTICSHNVEMLDMSSYDKLEEYLKKHTSV